MGELGPERTPKGGSVPPPALLSAEQTTTHTQILRLALAADESRRYWEHADPALSPAERLDRAFEQRWFGTKSVERVRLLLNNFTLRYDAYPGALVVLRRMHRMEAPLRLLVCHWHLQLADPTYRRFTGRFLVERRSRPGSPATVSRDAVMRWVEEQAPGRWAAATLTQFATKLLSAASEVGLVGGPPDPRELVLPRVPDRALEYGLHLLRELRFEGGLLSNPYLASVGLGPDALEVRLRGLSCVEHRRMGDMHELSWEHPSLLEWENRTHE